MKQREDEIRGEVAEIDLRIEELRRRRKALLAELGEGRLSWGAIIAGAFGALLIGLGVIALFAANWDCFNRASRAVISVVPVVLCALFAFVATVKEWRARAFWEMLGILWCLSIAAAVCLVAQTYHVGGSAPGLILFVALVQLPAIWLTRSATMTALWPVLAIAWTLASRETGSPQSLALGLKGCGLMALSLPALLLFLRGKPSKASRATVLGAIGLVYSFGVGLFFSMGVPLHFRHDASAIVACFWASSILVAMAGKFLFRFPNWATPALVVASLAAFPTPFLRGYEWGIYLAALVFAALAVAWNVRKLNLLRINLTAFMFLWLIVMKFLTSHAPFTFKGLVLIGSGFALALLNMLLIRLRKNGRSAK